MNHSTIIGSVGVTLTLLGYFLNITRLIPVNGHLFFILNILGAAIACYGSFLINYWPFVILEGTWTLVSVYGLVTVRRAG
jgi:hypothetical protein